MDAFLLPRTFLTALPPDENRPQPPAPVPAPEPRPAPRAAPSATPAPAPGGIFDFGSAWQGAKQDVKKGVLLGAQAAGMATAPVGEGLSGLGQGMSNMAGFLSNASDNANAIAKKVLIGELVLAGVTVVGVIAAVFLSTGNRPIAAMMERRKKKAEKKADT